MISVKETWDLVDYITNKENEGNTTTPEQRNLLLKAANIDVFKRRYGLPEEYQVGMPLPRIAYEQTQKIVDDMRDFKVVMGSDTSAMVVSSSGGAAIPSDYLHFAGAHVITTSDANCIQDNIYYSQAEHLTTAQIQDRLGNSIKKPTFKNPCFETRAGYFQWYPKDINSVMFTYIREPCTPVYGYTVVDDIVSYDASSSVDFEYPSDMFIDVVSVILSYLGINMRDESITQYSELRKQRG